MPSDKIEIEGVTLRITHERLSDILKEAIRALNNSINSSNPAQLSCQVSRNKLIELYNEIYGAP